MNHWEGFHLEEAQAYMRAVHCVVREVARSQQRESVILAQTRSGNFQIPHLWVYEYEHCTRGLHLVPFALCGDGRSRHGQGPVPSDKIPNAKQGFN